MRRPSGFTLIEILIAMAVFLIGMVSILAVFPAGIKASTKSTDQSVATAVAESLNDAITLALRQYDGSATSNVWFYHDGLNNPPGSGRDFFLLPPIETWVSGTTTYTANGRSRPHWYPADPSDTAAPGSTTALLQLPPAILASITNAKGGNIATLVGGAGGQGSKDFQDPLGMYSFRFMIHEYVNPNDATGTAFGGETAANLPYTAVSEIQSSSPTGAGDPGGRAFMYQNGAQAQVIDKLYQFTVYVYRGWKPVTLENTWWNAPGVALGPNVYRQTGASAGTTDTYQWQDQMQHPNKIERFEFLVYAPGAR